MLRDARQREVIGEVGAEIGIGVREGVVGGEAQTEVEGILRRQFEAFHATARTVGRLGHGAEPSARLVVDEHRHRLVDDEAVDLLPEKACRKQPLVAEVMFDTQVELVGAEGFEFGIAA